MKQSDVFPSNYLRAADLNGAEPVVTIRAVQVETFGDESKPIVFFQGKEKGVVLNKTNWNSLVEITGEDDSDNWTGHRVKLISVKVEYQGKRVPAIRMERAPKNGSTPMPPPPPPVEAPSDEDIPF